MAIPLTGAHECHWECGEVHGQGQGDGVGPRLRQSEYSKEMQHAKRHKCQLMCEINTQMHKCIRFRSAKMHTHKCSRNRMHKCTCERQMLMRTKNAQMLNCSNG